jgi:hypothetical protein
MRTIMNCVAGLALAAALLAPASSASADEGMWTVNNFPKDKVKAKYGFAPDDKWLQHVQLASARVLPGCSASFVSDSGLALTNHHCAHDCIHNLSTADKDYVKDGFYAKTQADEAMCPGMEIDQLVETTDVTERMTKATAGLTDEKANEARKAEMAKIEKECATSDALRCDVVSLYHGGIYSLYKYKRYQDVRLVFAPEFQIAFFGGDPDNFNFPRYDLDIAFLRIYEQDEQGASKPVKTPDYLKWSASGPKDGELTFVSGNPGGTDRLLTVAELEHERDVAMIRRLLYLAELRGFLNEYRKRGAEQDRVALEDVFYIENALKVYKGEYQALAGNGVMEQKKQDEAGLRERVNGHPEWKKKYGGAWDAIAKAMVDEEAQYYDLKYIEKGGGFDAQTWTWAKTLVRLADELPKKNDKRFSEYSDAKLPAVKQKFLAKKTYSEEFEIAGLAFSLTKLREDLGPDHPFVKKILGKDSPDDLAARLVKGSKLSDPDLRKKLWEGVAGKDGKKALAQVADDPMIKLAQSIDAEARKVRKKYEDTVESVLKRNDELVAQARFAAFGTELYPDATLTFRISYGAVKGWTEPKNGKPVKPFTNFAGAFERHTGSDPFALPKSWLDAKSKLDLKTSFDFVTTNDIVGGNSGSPLFNKDGEITGVAFDGNIHSLGGNYWFDEKVNRCVGVHSEAIIQALSKVYGANRLVNELRPTAPKKSK